MRIPEPSNPKGANLGPRLNCSPYSESTEARGCYLTIGTEAPNLGSEIFDLSKGVKVSFEDDCPLIANNIINLHVLGCERAVSLFFLGNVRHSRAS